MNRLISVIIPVYNHAAELKRSLFSLYRQTYRPLETIVVNDGSTDNFDKAMEEIKTKINLKIKVIIQERRGAAAARSRGFKESTGEYVIFWDADTLAKPEMLNKLFETLQNHPEASYAYSRFIFGWKKMRSREFNRELLRKENFIDTVSLISRSALIEVFGEQPPFDEKIKRFQDWDLWLTLLSKNKTGVLTPEILYKKLVGLRHGISRWLPAFIYRLPWKIKPVREYEAAREIILKNHKND